MISDTQSIKDFKKVLAEELAKMESSSSAIADEPKKEEQVPSVKKEQATKEPVQAKDEPKGIVIKDKQTETKEEVVETDEYAFLDSYGAKKVEKTVDVVSKPVSNKGDVISLCKALIAEDQDRYKQLTSNIMYSLSKIKDTKIVGITSVNTGEGKSVTAINIAYTLAHLGKKVLLIDGNYSFPSIASKLDISNTPGLLDILTSTDETTTITGVTQFFTNMFILPAGCNESAVDVYSQDNFRKLLDILKEYFEYILIDLPCVNQSNDVYSISKYLTGMLVVVSENTTTKQELNNVIEKLEYIGVSILGFILNNFRK